MGPAQRNLELVLNLRAEGLTQDRRPDPGRARPRADRRGRRSTRSPARCRPSWPPTSSTPSAWRRSSRTRSTTTASGASRSPAAASCPTSRGWRRPPSPRTWAAAPAQRLERHVRPGRRRACTATASIEHERRRRHAAARGARRRQPRPVASNPTFTVKFANQGDNDETNVKVTVAVSRRPGKAIAATKTIGQTKARQTATVNIPLGAGAAGRHADDGDRRDRQGRRARRRSTTTARATRSSSRASRRAMRAADPPPRAYPCAAVDDLSSTTGIVALVAAGAGARRARSPCSCSRARCAGCAPTSAASSASSAPQDLVAHAAELDRGFGVAARLRRRRRRQRSTRGWTTAEERLDGAVAYRGARPLRRLQRDVRAPVDLDRAARRARLGHRAVLDPPPRPGAALRQAGRRRARRARALARGGGGGARGAGRRGARRRRRQRRRARDAPRLPRARRARSARRRCAAGHGRAATPSSCRSPTIHEAVIAVARRRGRPRARADRELARGLGQRDARRAGLGRARRRRSSARSCSPIRNCLIAREAIALDDDRGASSRTRSRSRSARASCATSCPRAEVRAATSTAEAVRDGRASRDEPWAALGPRGAAERYGCRVLREERRRRARQRDALRVARRAPASAAGRADGARRRGRPRSSSPAPGDAPARLARALPVGVRLPRRQPDARSSRGRGAGASGHYLFLVDIEGRAGEPARRRRGRRRCARTARRCGCWAPTRRR